VRAWGFALISAWVMACGIACTGGVQALPALPRASAEELSRARVEGSALTARLRVPSGDLRQSLAIAIREGISGRGFEGRGVVAVRPRVALRMILLGPGGTTAMDVWIRQGTFRVAIPALEKVIRGDRSTPRETMRGLPIDFLDRWLLDPFGGAAVVAVTGIVEGGRLRDDERGFVRWAKRGAALEIRARRGDGDAQAWWVERGKVVAFLDGREAPVEGEERALFPVRGRFTSTDPPMTVEVTGEPAARAELPAQTFEDPDALGSER
jgi:hypothetical protein